MNLPFTEKDSTIARDLQLNLKRLLSESALSEEDRLLTLLTLSAALGAKGLQDFAREQLNLLGVLPELQQEAQEAAAMMAMLNTYYRFRHFLKGSSLAEDSAFQAAGLRMTALARPALGKERFEMLAFSLSVLNGCESCTVAHAEALKKHGVDSVKVHDLAKFAAVVKAIVTLH